jgi:hypothetical protein
MAGVKISALPVIPVAPQLTDIFPEVQPASGGTTYKTTFQQLYTLFSATSGTINAGLINQLAYYAAAGNTLSGLATANNGALVTSAGGVPSISSTLPSAVQTNITALGTQSQALNMGSHLINNVTDPVSAQDAATKNYVDQTALNGTSVYAATTTNLTVTQSGAGAGATLTNAGAQATFALDGVNPPVGSNVLIKDLAAPQNEGIYTVTNVGSGSTNWVLTRATTYDTPAEINRTGLIVVQNGSTLSGTAWFNSATIVTVDTTAFSYSQFGNITFPISLAHGGTNANLTATASNGGIFYSTASAGAILAGTATAGLALLSGASAAPTWSNSPPITRLATQVFSGSGTYTPTSGMKYCFIEVLGGGGAGGSSQGGASQTGAGGGGGAGGYNSIVATAATVGSSQTVTIGAAGTPGSAGNNPGGNGGTTSVGAIVSATGGQGGGAGATGTGGNGGAPGIGGSGGANGNFNGLVTGQSGATAFCTGITANSVILAAGANSIWGGGGLTNGVGNNGGAANGPGAGGAGSGSAATDKQGGAGGAGYVRITEYIST